MAELFSLHLAFTLDGLHDALMALPDEALSREDLAVIVPAFELKRGKNCGEFKNCAFMCVYWELLSCRAAKYIPNNKKELNACIKSGKCSTFRPKEKLHISRISVSFGIPNFRIIFSLNGMMKITRHC